jgi:tetratricopeptide (TPR) repeat protein
VRRTVSSEQARAHFEAALVHYRSGKYRRAITELEKAYGMDPTGKDLVYNLAVVYEKLGELDSAIHYLERYIALEPDPDEVTHASAMIYRLQGAQREVAPVEPETATSAPCLKPPLPSEGRLDGWVAATGGLAVASAAVGVVFGIKALSEHPSSDDRTGPEESREALRERSMRASTFARIADVAFAVSVVSGSATAVLYFGRSSGRERLTSVGVKGRF